MDVHGRPELAGRTVAEAFRPGGWRVVAVDRTPCELRRPLTSASSGDTLGRGITTEQSGIDWEPSPGLELQDGDRAVVVATREGLGLLLQRQSAPAPEAAMASAPVSRAVSAPAPAGAEETEDEKTVPLPTAPRPTPSPPYHSRPGRETGADSRPLDEETAHRLPRRRAPQGTGENPSTDFGVPASERE
jgi:hypothetical protein